MINKISSLFLLVFLVQSLHSQDMYSKARKIYITISQVDAIQSVSEKDDLTVIKQILLSLLLSGKLESKELNNENFSETDNPYKGKPILRKNDKLSFYYYGMSLKKCMEGDLSKLKLIFKTCFPKSGDKSFFSDSSSASYLAELELLRAYNDDSNSLWIDIGSGTTENKIPDSIKEELDQLHKTANAQKFLFKYEYKKNIFITFRQIEPTIPDAFQSKVENGGEKVILKLKHANESRLLNITSSPVKIQVLPNYQNKINITNLFFEIRTENNKVLRLKSQKTDFSDLIFIGNISEDELSLLQKKANIRLEYTIENKEYLQLLKEIDYEISLTNNPSEGDYNWVYIVSIITATLVFVIIFISIFNKIGDKKLRRSTAIKIYQIDTEQLNAKRFRVNEGDTIALGKETYKSQKCSILYDIEMEGHVIELVSSRSNRFLYTDLNNQSSREFVLPADVEVRDSRGKLIRISLEVMDKNNSAVMSI